MTIDEAMAEMKARGWGYSRNEKTGLVAVGTILNPDYGFTGEYPIIEMIAFDLDPVRAVQKAIEAKASDCKTCNGSGGVEVINDETGDGCDEPCPDCQYDRRVYDRRKV